MEISVLIKWLLGFATFLGGLAAIWFIYEKIACWWRRCQRERGNLSKRKSHKLAEKTYFRYRDYPVPLIDSPELIRHLEARYRCSTFQLGDKAFPVTIIWKNEDRVVAPDSILGEFDQTPPTALPRSPVFSQDEYVNARTFIKTKYETGPIKYEGVDYRMTCIDTSTDPPKIHGAYGLYYDNILTQYAMEWELKKALLKGGSNAIDTLTTLGTLPLREAVELKRNPLFDGEGRCAAITVSTLMVFKRQGGFYCLIRRRSTEVGVSPGMLHVVPAGMFEAKNLEDRWSVEMNVWRELLEEVYDEKEQQGSGIAEFEDYIRRKPPISSLIEMIKEGSAEFSVTGICCDLLNLRPEICTVLFVKDPKFSETAGRMVLNWEYEKEGPAGKFAVRWENIDEAVETERGSGGIVVSGAVCLELGRDWLRRRHGF